MNKIISLDVFGCILFEIDAIKWLELCKEQKKEWILKHTNQKDENLINEFINNPKISKECKCLDCGKSKKDEPNGISKETTTFIKSIEVGGNGQSDSFKRQPKVKRGKG